MTSIRKGSPPASHSAAQRRPVEVPQVSAEVLRDPAAKAILDAADREQRQHGEISATAFDAMLQRAMQAPPGGMSDAVTAALNHVIDHKPLSTEAHRDAEIIRHANRCRQEGHIRREDVLDMMKRTVDETTGEVRPTSATALRYVGWRDADVMDAGARELMSGFLSAWYEDQFESPQVAEGRRQLEEQLAQDKLNFKEFMQRDKTRHKDRTHAQLKEDLAKQRIDTSDWQSLMLWLKTGKRTTQVTW